jgi:hypothetical protein
MRVPSCAIFCSMRQVAFPAIVRYSQAIARYGRIHSCFCPFVLSRSPSINPARIGVRQVARCLGGSRKHERTKTRNEYRADHAATCRECRGPRKRPNRRRRERTGLARTSSRRAVACAIVMVGPVIPPSRVSQTGTKRCGELGVQRRGRYLCARLAAGSATAIAEKGSNSRPV